MNDLKFAVVGVGATGSVIAGALLTRAPDTILVDPRQGLREALLGSGLAVSGPASFRVPVRRAVASIADLKGQEPDVIFLSTKTFNLPEVVREIQGVFKPEMKIISTHNGLGTEDVIAEAFGPGAALRMILNFGAAVKGPGQVETTFFNKPNHLGGIAPERRAVGAKTAELLTAAGFDTELVEDIRLYVWKKMIMKCTMASICAVTDKTIAGALAFPPTREIAEASFREILSVAKAMGYDLGGEEYIEQALGYLEKVGVHKDSMCADVAARSPTEIDFLGGKVVEYARRKNIPVPFYTAMTNLVRAIEDNYKS
ncbi:MAG: 2-dehydropantoate 2-reductase [Deltaproteobacteria bacterium]|nr:2-dehydropantoate 2-reductase [Deltaproteobacteria bacterium]